jgi:hypothetical protein
LYVFIIHICILKVYNEALCMLQKQQTQYYGFNTTSSEFLQDLLFMSQDKWGDSLKVKKQLCDCIRSKGPQNHL